MYDGVALATLAALPFAALAVWVLVRGRALAGTTPARAWRRSLLEVGLVYGTLPGLWITMVPGNLAGVVPGRVSLVPLRDLATMGTFQIVGNLLIFAALGLLAPVRFAALATLGRTVVVAAIGSVLVETAQYVQRLDRVSSVDDVLLNTAGAGLAALVSRPWWRAPRHVGVGNATPGGGTAHRMRSGSTATVQGLSTHRKARICASTTPSPCDRPDRIPPGRSRPHRLREQLPEG
jgi:hypothetical protein